MRFGLQAIAAIAWLIALISLILLPDWRGWWHWFFVLVWTGASIAALRRAQARVRPWLALGAAALAFLPYASVTARNDRDWAPEQSRPPVIVFSDDTAVIHNFRHATYRTATDFDLTWTERTVDLGALRSVDYVLEPFSAWRGLAHTFLTFGFADGTHVAISIEARRERGEPYSTIKGMFRHFEVVYVIGDERDLIGLRANVRRNPVHLYPVQAQPERIRALFVSMLHRANNLAVRPEFYHSLDNTCAVAVLRHVNEVRPAKISGGWRALFPGYSDKFAWEIGLVGFEGTLAEARARYLINDRSAFEPSLDEAGWSHKIRTIASHD